MGLVQERLVAQGYFLREVLYLDVNLFSLSVRFSKGNWFYLPYTMNPIIKPLLGK